MHRYEGLLQFIDIGANLVDGMFNGSYNGSQKHVSDLNNVLARSWAAGLKKIIVTGTSLQESEAALKISEANDRLYSTVGCHPTNCNEFEKSGDPSAHLNSLLQLCKSSEKVVAIGEIGLDYDRLAFCSKDIQIKYFKEQLSAFEGLKLPLFLHCRNAAEDLVEILADCHETKGVVHSFDGSECEAKSILDLGFYIGINGCSLKTEENLEVVRNLPSDKILIETDSPWCEIRPSHSGYKYIKSKFPAVKKEKWESEKMVKGRNEPCNIIQVLEVLSAVKEEDILELGERIYKNTEELFFSK